MSSNHQLTTKKIEITAKKHTFDIKASINPLIPEKVGPKNETYSKCYEIRHSRWSSLLILNMIFENCGFWPEIEQIWFQNCNVFQLL